MKKIVPHVVVIALFAVIALAFFYPVLQGKGIFQSDIVQYTGMAKERNDYRQTENKETYWTNSAFGGMPTYQLGAQYPLFTSSCRLSLLVLYRLLRPTFGAKSGLQECFLGGYCLRSFYLLDYYFRGRA